MWEGTLMSCSCWRIESKASLLKADSVQHGTGWHAELTVLQSVNCWGYS